MQCMVVVICALCVYLVHVYLWEALYAFVVYIYVLCLLCMCVSMFHTWDSAQEKTYSTCSQEDSSVIRKKKQTCKHIRVKHGL